MGAVTYRKNILDHGYIEFIESWGSDQRIVEAARMSTDKGFQGWGPVHSDACVEENMKSAAPYTCYCNPKAGDEKLLKYLYENHHDTPFEMAGLIIEVKAPIMVFREWHRHRTQSYNEMSARYTPLPDENYRPAVERMMKNSASNKQAGVITGSDALTHENALWWLEILDATYRQAQYCYEEGLRIGVPKELARLCVPVGRYSKMRASANLRNWLAFMTLRSDYKVSGAKAQEEIRVAANCLGEIISQAFPRTWELFVGAK